MTESELDAYKQFQIAARAKETLKRDIEQGRHTRAEQLRTLDQLWSHIESFIPRHWREPAQVQMRQYGQ